MYFIYILKSEKDGRYYIGITKNLGNRIKQHNGGFSGYTSGRGPFKLVYKEAYNTLSEAKRREYYLKSLKSRIAIGKLIKKGAIV